MKPTPAIALVKIYDWRIKFINSRNGEFSCLTKSRKQTTIIKIGSSIKTHSGLQGLSHECCHAAYDILDAVGIKHGHDNQEPFAYLQDHIFRLGLEALQ